MENVKLESLGGGWVSRRIYCTWKQLARLMARLMKRRKANLSVGIKRKVYGKGSRDRTYCLTIIETVDSASLILSCNDAFLFLRFEM